MNFAVARLCLPLMVTLLGACTLNDTDFKLTPQDIVGDWALADAPLLLKSNHLAASNLTSYIQFRQDHYAVFQAVPVEELIDVGAGPPHQMVIVFRKWTLVSNRWWHKRSSHLESDVGD